MFRRYRKIGACVPMVSKILTFFCLCVDGIENVGAYFRRYRKSQPFLYESLEVLTISPNICQGSFLNSDGFALSLESQYLPGCDCKF